MDSQFQSLLIHTANILEESETQDANKRPIVTHTAGVTGVRCRIKPYVNKLGALPTVAGYILNSSHKCYMLPDAVVKEKDYVVCANTGVAGTYDVLHVDTPSDEVEVHHLTLYLKLKSMI